MRMYSVSQSMFASESALRVFARTRPPVCVCASMCVAGCVSGASWDKDLSVLGRRPWHMVALVLRILQILRPQRPTLSSCIDNERNISLGISVSEHEVQNLVDGEYWPTTLFTAKMSAVI